MTTRDRSIVPSLGAGLSRLTSRLKMRHIGLLDTLGRTSNIRKAAVELNMSQPSASALLREVEDAFDVELFVREPHGLVLTDHGRALIGWAGILLADLEKAQHDLTAISLGRGKRLKVGISPLAAPKLLPLALELFRKTGPDVIVSVTTGIETTLPPMLLSGEIDCAVCRMVPGFVREAVRHEMLYGEAASIVVRRDHPLARAERMEPALLDTFRWMLPVSEGAPYDLIASRLVSVGAKFPRVSVESWSAIVIVHLLQASDLISVLPRSIAEHYAEKVAILPFEELNILYPVVLTWRPRAEDLFFDSFLNAVREAAAFLHKGGDLDKRDIRSPDSFI